MIQRECIVVGSGCTGAMAAQTLVEAGAKVTLLDVGRKDDKYEQLIPDKDFLSIRQEENDQHRYFLGDDFESIPWAAVKTGEQLTAPRKFMIELVDQFLPICSENFAPLESLALGGLGCGWGVGCNVFSKNELEACGLKEGELSEAYRVVAERIGVSASQDDAARYTVGHLKNVLPVSKLDSTARPILQNYNRKKSVLNRKGFFLGRPALALLTLDRGERKKVPYRDLDFYTDKGKSAYRPWMTIAELSKQGAFEYIGSTFVVKFVENGNGVEVQCLETGGGEKTSFTCKKLVLASGVLGTARIVLRSLPNQNQKLPLLCNPYNYLACLQPTLVGTESERYRTSFAQLEMFHDEEQNNYDIAQASIYSYRSLLLFRLVKEVPLNFRDGRIFMQYLLPGITIVGIHHPDTFSESKYVELAQDAGSPTGDKLKVEYALSARENAKVDWREKKFRWAFRKLRCYPFKRIKPEHGSSIHYAGTLPFSSENRPFSLCPNGKLYGTNNVFVADGSGFRYAPAKGITFTLMANAHNVAKKVLRSG